MNISIDSIVIEQDLDDSITKHKWRVRSGNHVLTCNICINPGPFVFLPLPKAGYGFVKGFWFNTIDDARHAFNIYRSRERRKNATGKEPVIEYDEKKEYLSGSQPCWRVRWGEYVFDYSHNKWKPLKSSYYAGFWRDSEAQAVEALAIAMNGPLPERFDCKIIPRFKGFDVESPNGYRLLWMMDPAWHLVSEDPSGRLRNGHYITEIEARTALSKAPPPPKEDPKPEPSISVTDPNGNEHKIKIASISGITEFGTVDGTSRIYIRGVTDNSAIISDKKIYEVFADIAAALKTT